MLRVSRDGELQLRRTAAAVVRAEVLHADDLRLPVADHQLTVADQQSTGVIAGDSDDKDFARQSVDAVADTEDELVRRRRLRVAVETDCMFVANSSIVDVSLGEVLTFVQLRVTTRYPNVL